ncbi:Spy/CpxP family protein refolding chaperone [Shewanella sp. YIC-542]|uniref:Spy/CpxP family protein refolding chaperone n=1 Tax=Shewanella mytili TaxID=3377111 RepID=UPI00398EBB4B
MVKHLKTGMLMMATVSGLWATGAMAATSDNATAPAAQPACQCPHQGQRPCGQRMGPGKGMKMQGGYHGMQGGYHGMGMAHRGMGLMALHQLDLTAEQETAMQKLFAAQRESRMAQRSERRQEMQALMTAAKFDEAKAKQLIEQRQQLRMQHQLQRMKLHNEIYQLLTDDQKAKFKAQLQKMPMWNAPQDY